MAETQKVEIETDTHINNNNNTKNNAIIDKLATAHSEYDNKKQSTVNSTIA